MLPALKCFRLPLFSLVDQVPGPNAWLIATRHTSGASGSIPLEGYSCLPENDVAVLAWLGRIEDETNILRQREQFSRGRYIQRLGPFTGRCHDKAAGVRSQ